MSNNLSVSYTPAMYTTARTAVQATGRYTNDIQNMIKYVNGQPLTPQDSMPVSSVITGNIPFLGIFGGYEAYKNLKKHGFNLQQTINAAKAASPIKTRAQYMEAATAGVSEKFKDVFKSSVPVSDAERWKIFKLFDKIPGYSRLRHTGFGQMMKKTGAGNWAVFSGIAELLSQVLPAFQEGGAEAGFKQLGKSGVKVAADAAGFIAGDVIFRGLGAAIGTFIAPGVGTTIGSYIGGFLGGIVGSAIAGKAVKSIVGPSEIEKIQEKQTEQVAEEINANSEQKIALAQSALQQAEAVLSNDPQNADALKIKESAEKVLAETTQTQEPAVAPAQNNAIAYNQPSTMQPVFNGIPVVPGFNGISYDMNTYRQSMQTASMPSTSFGQITTMTTPFGTMNYPNQVLPQRV